MPEALQELTEEELSICKQPACVLGGFGLEYFPGNSSLVMNVCIFALFSHDLGKCTFDRKVACLPKGAGIQYFSTL